MKEHGACDLVSSKSGEKKKNRGVTYAEKLAEQETGSNVQTIVVILKDFLLVDGGRWMDGMGCM